MLREPLKNQDFSRNFSDEENCEKVSVLDVRALEQISSSEKLPKKTVFQRFLKLFAILTLVSSCGFKVIYKERDRKSDMSYVHELAAIRIEKERNRLGQKVKNSVYDTINPDNLNSEPKYFLSLKTAEASYATYITPTGSSGRNTVTLTVSYSLQNLKTGDVISTGSASANDSYDVSSNRYASYKTGNYTQSNLTKVISQNIRNSLVNDFIEEKRKCLGEFDEDEEVEIKEKFVCKLVEDNL